MSLYQSDRHWYNVNTGELVTIPFGSDSHTGDVQKRPEAYGIAPEELDDAIQGDYDPLTLDVMFSHGWVRVRFDRRNPDLGTNLEGRDWKDLRKATKFIADQVPGIRRLIIVARASRKTIGNNEEHRILDQDGIERFIKHGVPPRQGQMAAEDQEIAEIRRRAGLMEAGAGASRITQKIKQGTPFFAISAFRSPQARGLEHDVPKNDRLNNRLTHQLRTDLAQEAVRFIPVMGGYQEQEENRPHEEKRFFVLPTRKTGTYNTDAFLKFAIYLCAKYNQEAIMFGDGDEIRLYDRDGNKFHTLGNQIRFQNIDPQGWTRIKSQRFSATNKPGIRYGQDRIEQKAAAE